MEIEEFSNIKSKFSNQIIKKILNYEPDYSSTIILLQSLENDEKLYPIVKIIEKWLFVK